MVDEYAHMRPGTRVEALKAGTQGTWYVARIVELASFPGSYLDGDEDTETPQQWYPMVCVHYEGVCPVCLCEVADPRFFTVAISLDSAIVIAVDVRSGGYVSFRME